MSGYRSLSSLEIAADCHSYSSQVWTLVNGGNGVVWSLPVVYGASELVRVFRQNACKEKLWLEVIVGQ